jgi:hypothetical protein
MAELEIASPPLLAISRPPAWWPRSKWTIQDMMARSRTTATMSKAPTSSRMLVRRHDCQPCMTNVALKQQCSQADDRDKQAELQSRRAQVL